MQYNQLNESINDPKQRETLTEADSVALDEASMELDADGILPRGDRCYRWFDYSTYIYNFGKKKRENFQEYL